MINIMPGIMAMSSSIAAINLLNLSHTSEIENNEELEKEILEVLSKDIPIEIEVNFDSCFESIDVSDTEGEFLDEETFNKIIENAKNAGLITKDKYEDVCFKWRKKGKPHFLITFKFAGE